MVRRKFVMSSAVQPLRKIALRRSRRAIELVAQIACLSGCILRNPYSGKRLGELAARAQGILTAAEFAPRASRAPFSPISSSNRDVARKRRSCFLRAARLRQTLPRSEDELRGPLQTSPERLSEPNFLPKVCRTLGVAVLRSSSEISTFAPRYSLRSQLIGF